MTEEKTTTNVIVAGLGGQGVLKASDILSDAAFLSGLDVKKSEIHGMSQRGGFVTSDVRFGPEVFSPMVPTGEADCLVVLASDQLEAARPLLRKDGVLLEPALIDLKTLANPRSFNVAMMGALSAFLDIAEETWLESVRRNLNEKLHEVNLAAFATGRGAGKKLRKKLGV